MHHSAQGFLRISMPVKTLTALVIDKNILETYTSGEVLLSSVQETKNRCPRGDRPSKQKYTSTNPSCRPVTLQCQYKMFGSLPEIRCDALRCKKLSQNHNKQTPKLIYFKKVYMYKAILRTVPSVSFDTCSTSHPIARVLTYVPACSLGCALRYVLA